MVAGSGRRWSTLAAMWRYACILALLCAALLRCNALKRAEMSPVPFVLSSRYGRSPPRMLMPRSDRFFMGTRYGKRSEAGMRAIGGEGGAIWRGECDCDHYARRLSSLPYKRMMGAPERVPNED